MMSCVVRAFDWEGDRGGCGRVGGAFDVCVRAFACVCVCKRIMVDLEKCTSGSGGALCGGIACY